MFEEIKHGDQALLIWSGVAPPKKIEEIVHQLNSSVGSTGNVAVEHEERLALCKCFKRGFKARFQRNWRKVMAQFSPEFESHSMKLLLSFVPM